MIIYHFHLLFFSVVNFHLECTVIDDIVDSVQVHIVLSQNGKCVEIINTGV